MLFRRPSHPPEAPRAPPPLSSVQVSSSEEPAYSLPCLHAAPAGYEAAEAEEAHEAVSVTPRRPPSEDYISDAHTRHPREEPPEEESQVGAEATAIGGVGLVIPIVDLARRVKPVYRVASVPGVADARPAVFAVDGYHALPAPAEQLVEALLHAEQPALERVAERLEEPGVPAEHAAEDDALHHPLDGVGDDGADGVANISQPHRHD